MKNTFSTLVGASTLAVGMALTTMTASAQATVLYFDSGSGETATMTTTPNIGESSGTWTVDFENTSTNYAPGITGVGFNFTPEAVTITSWVLTAKDSSGNTVNLGCSTGACTNVVSKGNWTFEKDNQFNGSDVNGNTFVFGYTNTTDKGVNGAIYNDDYKSGSPASNPWFGPATLEFTIDPDAVLNQVGMRMQNVGADGEGSLKLIGQPGQPVPEPLTILGAGAAISFGTAFKRKLGKAKKSDEKA